MSRAKESSRDSGSYPKWIEERHEPTLGLVYLPHLDYCLQCVGHDGESVATDLREIEEAARTYLALGNKDGLAHCLEGYAGAATVEESYREAAKLAGVAASLREESGLPTKGYEDQPHLKAAREALDQREFEQAFRDGYEQGYEEALRERMEH